jgi:multiple sugar transport system permease protein
MTEQTARILPFIDESATRNDVLYHIAKGILTALVLLWILFPMYWMLASAFRPLTEIFSSPVLLVPQELTLENFEMVLIETTAEYSAGEKFPRYYVNSISYSIGVIILTTTFATLGGYGLARVDIPYKKLFARGILFGYMFPAILLAIPMFIFWRQLGILNTYIGIVLAETAKALPFSVWLMWQQFQQIPKSAEESAMMAGAPRFRAFYEVTLPVARPAMAAVAIFAYAVSWNAYTMPRILLPDQAHWPGRRILGMGSAFQLTA